ncbi:hypothetical protein B566_EDAN015291, partial [Ephemera danica]
VVPIDGSYYVILKGPFKYEEAEAACKACGCNTQLAIFETQREVDAVATYLNKINENNALWIGFKGAPSPSPTYVWNDINSTPVTFPVIPTGKSPRDECGSYDASKGLISENCQSSRSAFCQVGTC